MEQFPIRRLHGGLIEKYTPAAELQYQPRHFTETEPSAGESAEVG
jgi:hypothetical protein